MRNEILRARVRNYRGRGNETPSPSRQLHRSHPNQKGSPYYACHSLWTEAKLPFGNRPKHNYTTISILTTMACEILTSHCTNRIFTQLLSLNLIIYLFQVKIEFFLFLRKALLYEGMWLYPLGLFYQIQQFPLCPQYRTLEYVF